MLLPTSSPPNRPQSLLCMLISTASVCGLRRAGWSLSSVFDEYLLFAGLKVIPPSSWPQLNVRLVLLCAWLIQPRQADQRFIELFEPSQYDLDNIDTVDEAPTGTLPLGNSPALDGPALMEPQKSPTPKPLSHHQSRH